MLHISDVVNFGLKCLLVFFLLLLLIRIKETEKNMHLSQETEQTDKKNPKSYIWHLQQVSNSLNVKQCRSFGSSQLVFSKMLLCFSLDLIT